MRFFAASLALLLGMSLPPFAAAQGNGVTAETELVIPQVSVFSAGTSIMVPDRGNAYVGGVKSASSQRTTTRPGWSNSRSRSGKYSAIGASVTIVDFEEWEASLGKPTATARARGGAGDRTALASEDGRRGAADREAEAAQTRATSAMVTEARELEQAGHSVGAALLWRWLVDHRAAEVNMGEARRRLDVLSRNPVVIATLDEPVSALALADARRTLADGKVGAARIYLGLALQKPETPSGREAAKMLSELGTRKRP